MKNFLVFIFVAIVLLLSWWFIIPYIRIKIIENTYDLKENTHCSVVNVNLWGKFNSDISDVKHDSLLKITGYLITNAATQKTWIEPKIYSDSIVIDYITYSPNFVASQKVYLFYCEFNSSLKNIYLARNPHISIISNNKFHKNKQQYIHYHF